jgi:hypothetical protein
LFTSYEVIGLPSTLATTRSIVVPGTSGADGATGSFAIGTGAYGDGCVPALLAWDHGSFGRLFMPAHPAKVKAAVVIAIAACPE